MSTITCSNFLKRGQLSPYENDRYLLAAQGGYLELYDLDKYCSDEFDPLENTPVRTLVFEHLRISNFVIFKETGHVLAVAKTYLNSEKTFHLRACLIHRDLLLSGGYGHAEDEHVLYEENINEFPLTFSMSVIPNTTEVIILTGRALLHFEYYHNDDMNVVYDVIGKYELSTLLHKSFKDMFVNALCIGDSSNYSLILYVGPNIVLLKQEGGTWSSRSMKADDYYLAVVIIPDTEIAAAIGEGRCTFFSTSSRQPGVRLHQLRIIYERETKTTPRAITSSVREGITFVYVFEDKELSLFRIENQLITYVRTFVHTPTNFSAKNWLENKDAQYIDKEASVRREMKRVTPYVTDSVLAAVTMNKKFGGSLQGLLIISSECGHIQVLRTDDIIKVPIYAHAELEQQALSIENLYPCWNSCLHSTETIFRLTGLNDGIPTLFNLENEKWTTTSLNNSTVKYSSMKSSVTSEGHTVAVFYNNNDICICLFDTLNQFDRGKEDRLSCEIKNVFLNDVFMCIITDVKVIIVDLVRFVKQEAGTHFTYTSFGMNVLGVTHQLTTDIQTMAVFNAHKQGENEQIQAVIYFHNTQLRIVSLVKTSLCSTQTPSIQEIYEKLYFGFSVKVTVQTTCTSPIIGMTTTFEGNFWLFKDGTLYRPDTATGVNLLEYLPNEASIDGFITIHAADFMSRRTFIMARCDGILYLKDVATLADVTAELIPSGFGDNTVFGHFNEPSKDGRCVLYTTSTRDGVVELVSVKARVNIARKRETLVYGSSLYQPDTTSRLIHYVNASGKSVVCLISAVGNTIQLHELSAKGRITFKEELELFRTGDNAGPIYISCFDVNYVRFSGMLYIVVGSVTKDLVFVTWDLTTNQRSYSQFTEQSSIRKLSFFGEEPLTNSARFAITDETHIHIVRYYHQAKTISELYDIVLRTRTNIKEDKQVHVVCNGDALDVQNIWCIDENEAVLHPVRSASFLGQTISYTFAPGKGPIEFVSSMSTRDKNDALNNMYADFVFVKNDATISILVTVQAISRCPDRIRFRELFKFNKLKATAVHGELLESFVKGDLIHTKFRMYCAMRNRICFLEYSLIIDSKSDNLRFTEWSQFKDIHTSIDDPSFLVISNIKKTANGDVIRFAIISGYEGTEVVRICPIQHESAVERSG